MAIVLTYLDDKKYTDNWKRNIFVPPFYMVKTFKEMFYKLHTFSAFDPSPGN